MAPKKITIVDASHGEIKWKLSSEEGYKTVLCKFGVESLIDNEDCMIGDFESLKDRGKYTLGQPQKQQHGHALQSQACDVKFTILRNNRQADGLRKLITQAAARNSGFYASNATTTEDRHMAAFKSISVPGALDISSWSQGDSDCGRLLSVHLHFLAVEKAATFEGEVIKLLQDRPSAALVNTQNNTVSTNIESLCDMSLTTPTKTFHPVHDFHYTPRQSTDSVAMEAPFDSKDDCDLTVTVTATSESGSVENFDENDPLWPSHAIENRGHFMLFAIKAHIFPHNQCVKMKQKDGKRIKLSTNYEWLDDPTEADFNFLYLSPNMHLCFDGSAGGRGIELSTQAAVCIEPLARTIDDETGVKRFKIDKVDQARLATIPLRVWCRSLDVAEKLKKSFVDGKQTGYDSSVRLHYFENISIQCVDRLIHMGREPQLMGDSQERIYVYNKRVPFMDERLSGAWSITKDGCLSSTEIMEKCLLWAANRTWNEDWKDTVERRSFESRTG